MNTCFMTDDIKSISSNANLQKHIPKKENVVLAAIRGAAVGIGLYAVANIIIGFFTKNTNNTSAAPRLGTFEAVESAGLFGFLDTFRAINHNKKVDELTDHIKKQQNSQPQYLAPSQQDNNFAERYEQEKAAKEAAAQQQDTTRSL